MLWDCWGLAGTFWEDRQRQVAGSANGYGTAFILIGLNECIKIVIPNIIPPLPIRFPKTPKGEWFQANGYETEFILIDSNECVKIVIPNAIHPKESGSSAYIALSLLRDQDPRQPPKHSESPALSPIAIRGFR
jgi:hypothetical protein